MTNRSFFLLKFYFVTMYQPAVDPDLNNDISIVRAVAMMCHQPYIEVIDTAQVDILSILTRKNSTYKVCTEYLSSGRFMCHGKGIFMPTLQFECRKESPACTITLVSPG